MLFFPLQNILQLDRSFTFNILVINILVDVACKRRKNVMFVKNGPVFNRSDLY